MPTGTPSMTAALGEDDYGALYGMLRSPDATQRAQGAALAQKLTPDEQHEFFDFQQHANQGKGELGRDDASLFGMPPELAVWGGVSAARAIGSAVTGAGLSLGQRAFAGAKAALEQAAPAMKYELVKSGLEHLGVPSSVAAVAGMAVSGYGRGSARTTAAAEAMPADAAATSRAGSSAAGTAPARSAPTPAAAATGPAAPSRTRAPVPAPQTPPVPTAPSADPAILKVAGDLARAGYSREEIAQAIQWRKQGVPSGDVLDRLEAVHQLRQSGSFAHLPDDFEAARKITERNTQGRWP